MAVWQVQDAKARFSEFLDAALRRRPQVVSRRGISYCGTGADCRVEAPEGRSTPFPEGIAAC